MTWDADVSLFVAEADMEALALFGVTDLASWQEARGADVASFGGETGMKTVALWGVTE